MVSKPESLAGAALAPGTPVARFFPMFVVLDQLGEYL